MDEVIAATNCYKHRFFNTANPNHIDEFPGPVVLTVNPGKKTDTSAYLLDDIPENLMYVRFRTNAWNLTLADTVIEHYTSHEVPIVMTFMAYFLEKLPDDHKEKYMFRQRTMNSYWAITTEAWREIMSRWQDNIWVSGCSKIEGEKGTYKCRHCGVCLREYFATMERMHPMGG